MKEPESQFRRAISPNEHLYLAGERLSPPFAVQVFVEGRGAVDLERLSYAVAEASKACPGARLVSRGGLWVDSRIPPPVRVIESRGFDGHRFDQLPELRARFSPQNGPTCDLLLLPGPTLVFRAFHGVMDGQGVLAWMRDVFRALRGEEPVGAPSDETDLGLLTRRGRMESRSAFPLDCASPLGSGGQHATEFFWKRRTLEGDHPALVAKLAERLGALSGRDRHRFMVPVDLRRHDPRLRSTANLSLPLFLDVHRGDRWDVLHERLLAALAAHGELVHDSSERLVSSLPTWGIEALLRALVTMQRARRAYRWSGVLSHLGRIDLAHYSGGGFVAETCYSLPVHAPLSPISLVAVQLPNRVELTLACPRGGDSEQRAEKLLDDLQDALTPPARIASEPQTEVPFPSDQTLAELFRAQVQADPEAVALVLGEERLTYAQLDRRSDALAESLRSQGVTPGTIVGLVADRTIDVIVALWGILKAGGAYLPIDPEYPDDRISFMLSDSAAWGCLTSERHGDRLGRLYSGPLLHLEAFETSSPPATLAGDPEDLAYVIYTSGSTGRPKGVTITHRNLLNYLHWAMGAYEVTAATRFALFTSLSFDLSVTSLLLPLLAGGSVALFPETLDHVVLRRILHGSGVNALKLTPTHLDLLSRLDVTPQGFHVLIVGGEELKGSLAASAQARFGPQCRIFNEYGPTEATVGCIVHRFDSKQDGKQATVPIGLPMNNMRAVLLDSARHPPQAGETAELYLAGEGVSPGYLNRPDLDGERFVTLPDGTRAYRTGDLARRRPEGELEFCGRTDHQLKIRGYRIEPGEIEAVLEEHPQVDRAVVLGRARTDSGEKVLCAYLVTHGPLESADIRDFLAARLPSPLVPGYMTTVDRIPLTPHGKVDAEALPSPLIDEGSLGAEAERDEFEEAIAAVWADVLGVDTARLAPDSDFWSLGGDSLRMVEMLAAVSRLSQAEEAFMREVRSLLSRPTLAAVCHVARTARREGETS